jgi:hypothetical protein
MDIPMLEEHEWEDVHPHLLEGIQRIKDFRQKHSASLAEAKGQIHGRGALERYFHITGFRETNVNALWHHRACQFGSPCRNCGKPLRTPRAKLCAECGAPV